MVARRPTQADVARVAGVSRQLVSLVVRGDPHVADGTRARVEDALRQLSYRPNSAARTLAANRSGQVAVLVPDLTNPFYGELTQLLATTLGHGGLSALIATAPDARGSAEVTSRMLSLGVDACILASPRLERSRLEAMGSLLPTVVLTDDDRVPHTMLIHADSSLGMSLTTGHLLEEGYSPVALVSPEPSSAGDSVHERTHGYLRTMGEAGAFPLVLRTHGETTPREIASRLIRDHGPGLGLACHDDFTALSCLMAINEAGLRPGRDVGVTGFDDSSVAGVPGVSLTSVDQGLSRMVDLAASTVHTALETREPALCDGETVIRPRLTVRASSRRAP